MTRRMDEATAIAMMKELEEIEGKVEFFLAKYHDLGQTHWLGEEEDGPAFVAPSSRTKDAFREARRASKALGHASHAMAMLIVEGWGKSGPGDVA